MRTVERDLAVLKAAGLLEINERARIYRAKTKFIKRSGKG